MREQDCWDWWNLKQKNPEKFRKTSNGHYALKTLDRYDCEWNHLKKRKFTHITLKMYPAEVVGSSHLVRTPLTRGPCYHDLQLCRAKEDFSIIVWHKTSHNFVHTIKLGRFNVHQIGDWFLVPGINIGSVAIQTSKSGNKILLEGGIIIQKPLFNAKKDRIFEEAVKKYFHQVGENIDQQITSRQCFLYWNLT